MIWTWSFSYFADCWSRRGDYPVWLELTLSRSFSPCKFAPLFVIYKIISCDIWIAMNVVTVKFHSLSVYSSILIGDIFTESSEMSFNDCRPGFQTPALCSDLPLPPTYPQGSYISIRLSNEKFNHCYGSSSNGRGQLKTRCSMGIFIINEWMKIHEAGIND